MRIKENKKKIIDVILSIILILVSSFSLLFIGYTIGLKKSKPATAISASADTLFTDDRYIDKNGNSLSFVEIWCIRDDIKAVYNSYTDIFSSRFCYVFYPYLDYMPPVDGCLFFYSNNENNSVAVHLDIDNNSVLEYFNYNGLKSVYTPGLLSIQDPTIGNTFNVLPASLSSPYFYLYFTRSPSSSVRTKLSDIAYQVNTKPPIPGGGESDPSVPDDVPDDRYNEGYDVGYTAGYGAGYTQGSLDNVDVVYNGPLDAIFGSVDKFLGLKIVGNDFTLGNLLGIGLGIILLGFAIKIFLGG